MPESDGDHKEHEEEGNDNATATTKDATKKKRRKRHRKKTVDDTTSVDDSIETSTSNSLPSKPFPVNMKERPLKLEEEDEEEQDDEEEEEEEEEEEDDEVEDAIRRAQARGRSPVRSLSRKLRERKHHHKKVAKKRFKKRWVLLMLLGSVLGALLLFYAQQKYPEFFLGRLQMYLGELNVTAVLPAPIANMGELLPSMPEMNMTILNDLYDVVASAVTPANETYPGLEAAAEGYKAKYPIVLVPGFVTTGLEVWEGEECASSLFRQRLWGSYLMVQTMLIKGACWVKHMSLDMETGLDPPGIRIRPAQGLEAADFFMPGYWVFAKLIRDFAAIGYDHRNLILMSYDWRLSLHDLEATIIRTNSLSTFMSSYQYTSFQRPSPHEPCLYLPSHQRRDFYYTNLKARIELLTRINNKKCVIIAHSYGTNVLLYFFAWVESPKGGNGGPTWVNDHVHFFTDIAGPKLGVIKAATSYLSGEMHDTAELPRGVESMIFGSESHSFHRLVRPATSHLLALNRRKLFRTWGSLTAMLPKGGKELWGDLDSAPEDVDPNAEPAASGECLPTLDDEDGHFKGPSDAPMRSEPKGAGDRTCTTAAEQYPPIRHGQAIGFTGGAKQNWTIDELMGELENDPEDPHLRRRLTEDYDFGYLTKFDKSTKDNKKYWTNPMSVPLPNAPDMKILCVYGVGKPTERAYIYKTDEEGKVDVIDVGIKDPARNISEGVIMGEGDGTVTLMSLGYHCSKLWKGTSPHNPAGIPVTTKEILHVKEGLLVMRGCKESDHVNIMGNSEMAFELLKIVSGREDEVMGHDQYYSSILDIVEKVKLT